MPSSTLSPGARIGKYRILAHIATGGMGAVYQARDENLGRIVALKVLARELTSNELLVERFKREARHAARMSHKNIVTLYESDSADGDHYLAMEYIEGIDLSEYIRRKGKLDPEESRRIIIQACKALAHAASMGITHRDIKPSNFLLANDEGRCRVKLTDLGLARMSNEEEFRVTRAGTTVGTVDYMAPEQARDASLADVRSDIYSLGCTFYHMLAGEPPFAKGGIGERVYQHLAADPPDVRIHNPAVSPGLWTVLRRMLAKHPDDRFQSPNEVIEALRSLTKPVAPSQLLPDSEDTPAVELGEGPAVRPPDSSQETAMAIQATTHGTPEISEPRPKAPEKPTQRKRHTTVTENQPTTPDPSEGLGITPEQRQAAAGQFAHATEVIRSGGDVAYATDLLLTCCRLDPGNILYRKMLREVIRDHAASKKASWFGSFTNFPARGKLRNAKKAGEHRKVLEEGELLLTRHPGDLSTQLDMAEAAVALNLLPLAGWLLEEARQATPENLTVLRALAEVYGKQKRYKQAIALWEKVRELDPTGSEAPAKIRELAVNETLAKGNYRL